MADSMVFGESVLNDAVAIVLYKTIDRHSHATYWLTTGAPRCAMGVLYCAATWDLDRARTARESICCRFNPRDCQPDCDVTAIALLGAVWFFIKVWLAGLS